MEAFSPLCRPLRTVSSSWQVFRGNLKAEDRTGVPPHTHTFQHLRPPGGPAGHSPLPWGPPHPPPHPSRGQEAGLSPPPTGADRAQQALRPGRALKREGFKEPGIGQESVKNRSEPVRKPLHAPGLAGSRPTVPLPRAGEAFSGVVRVWSQLTAANTACL